jgi:hypothetical protein
MSDYREDDQQDNTSKRGFASMPREKVQEIASKGGKARAEKARQNRDDREQGGSTGQNLDDELNRDEDEIGEEE